MKFNIYLLALVASCRAGYESSQDHGSSDTGPSNHVEYSKSSSSSDHDNHNTDNTNYANSQNNHNFAGVSDDYSGAQQHDFSNAQSHGFAPLTHDVSPGTHDFSAGIHDFAAGAHDFSGHQAFPGYVGHYSAGLTPTGHDFSGGKGQVNFQSDVQERGYDVGPHNDYSAFGASGVSGDSYLQAAQDSAHQGDENKEGSHHDGLASGPSASGPSSHGGDNADIHSLNPHLSHAQLQSFILQDGGHEFGNDDHQNQQGHGFDGQVESVPVGEHVDYENPVAVPLYKHVTVPVHKPLQINVPKPILVGVPQPYPVKVPIHKPVPVPVETEISIPIVKPVPYPVVKHIPYPVEKHIPFKVEKTVTVHVPQPYPVKIPVYKTIHHHKDHH